MVPEPAHRRRGDDPAAEAFLHVDTDFEVPADLEPGVYRAVVEVNPLGVIFEHERRDNTALSDEFLSCEFDEWPNWQRENP